MHEHAVAFFAARPAPRLARAIANWRTTRACGKAPHAPAAGALVAGARLERASPGGYPGVGTTPTTPRWSEDGCGKSLTKSAIAASNSPTKSAIAATSVGSWG